MEKLKSKILNQQTPFIERWDKKTCCNLSMGGTTGYIITKTGALNMLNHIKKYGMYNAIDWVMHKTADEQRICYTFPYLVTADCYTPLNTVDTDIQNDFTTLKMTDQEWDNYEINTILNYYNKDYKIILNFDNETNTENNYLIKIFNNFNILLNNNENKEQNTKKILNIYFNKINLFNISIITISQLKNEINKLQNFPIHYYKTNNLAYIINDKYISLQIFKDKIFGDDLLN